MFFRLELNKNIDLLRLTEIKTVELQMQLDSILSRSPTIKEKEDTAITSKIEEVRLYKLFRNHKGLHFCVRTIVASYYFNFVWKKGY